MVWPATDPWCPVVEYETLKERLRDPTNLNEAILALGEYNWLPTEGTDFEVRMSSATVNGVTN